jgi:hypothetical protein
MVQFPQMQLIWWFGDFGMVASKFKLVYGGAVVRKKNLNG